MAYRFVKLISPAHPPINLPGKSYICDTPDDIQNLPRFKIEGTQILTEDDDPTTNKPCNYASEAIVTSPFSGYMLNASNTWVQIF
jgi:hypothetical protein